MSSVTLKGINKTYPGPVEAVKSLDLQIEDKEFIVLVGPSGCGKSTTLRMIAGLEEVTAGDIHIGDRRVNDVAPKDRDIAMVFQNYALYPHMTVFKNMAFGLKLRKTPKAEIKQRVHDAAEILGITDLLQRKPKALSGGQRQRVAVGRAIVRDPKVFLFDEPLSNLDAKLRVQMRAEISKLHNRLQATMIYVTHDQVEAMTMGDRIVVMLDGEIQQVATPLELYHRPANTFVASFIGSPAMNLIQGQLSRNNGDLHFRDTSSTLQLNVPPTWHDRLASHTDGPVTLGVRPEDLSENPTQSPIDGQSIQANVEVAEPLGAEINLYLRLGDQTLTSRIHAQAKPEVDKPHVVDVNLDNLHFFDAETTKALR